jgi:hypothetical protein
VVPDQAAQKQLPRPASELVPDQAAQKQLPRPASELVPDRAAGARSHWRSRFTRPRMLVIGAGGIGALALLAGTLQGLFAGGGAPSSATPTQTGGFSAAAALQADAPHHPDPALAALLARGAAKCPLVAQPYGYVNPLAHARVMPERIDQGVDYAGSGSLGAIGAGKMTYVAAYGPGWPVAFIEYRLLDGGDSGCYVYYAEGVTPAAGLRVGQKIRAGQAIATIIPYYETGIEIGWGAGSSTTTYAAKAKQWTAQDDADNIPTPAGESFSSLIASLGGPPGKMEGESGPRATSGPRPRARPASTRRPR